jgi:choline dehydrogenase-like flavoprotein
MPAKFDLNDLSVVVIVGSGAGGGVLANELAKKGISVVVLEAGKRVEITDFRNDEVAMFSLFTWLDPRTTSGSWSVAKTSADLPIWTCKLVGGTTVHWGACALRFQEHEFKTKTRYGDIGGANLLDWPIDLNEMAPYYDRAELRMGVTGTHGIPRLPASNHGTVLFAGAKKVGYTKFQTTNMAINPVPRDGRASCQQTGFCVQGCTFGAKWSTLYIDIPQAEATGKAEVRAESQVLRVEHDASGKVNAVVYADESGTLQRQRRARWPWQRIRSKARGCCSTRPRACSPKGWPTPQGRLEGTTCATRPARSSRSTRSRFTCIAEPRSPES